MNFRTIGVNIAVEKERHKPAMQGGILIPECAERTPRFSPSVYATVRAVGGKVTILKVGDRVVVQNHAGDDFMVGKKTLTILREKDIVGVVQ